MSVNKNQHKRETMLTQNHIEVYYMNVIKNQQKEGERLSLKDAIDKSGRTVTWLANNMGISREGLHKKIRGESEFKASEIVKIKELLSLFDSEVNEYFFAKCSD